MDIWGFYFFAKLFLFYGQYIDFHLWPNVAFAALLAPPLPQPWMRTTRQVLALPVAAALLYYDSWLPPVGRVIAQTPELASFDLAYLTQLLGRFINPRVCFVLLAMLVIYVLLSLRLRMRTFAVLAMLATPLIAVLPRLTTVAPGTVAGPGAVAETAPADASDAGLDRRLAAFFAAEKTRRVSFPALPADGTPFDVIFLQICSLSWDDLRAVKLQDAPQLKKFDAMLTDFNTVASYSGPAAIRLLRGPCGQDPHEALYAPAPEGCYLMGELKRAGFEPSWAMNHNGKFGNFTADVHERGGLDAPQHWYADLPTVQREFDGSPVQSDYAVLSRWWQERLSDPAPHVALYYNTASLHDGNRLVDSGALPAQQSYEVRASRLLTDVSRFLDLIEKSQRRALVFFVPEHGANLRGDRMQISGLREIPTPAITLAPAGVAIIGPGLKHGEPLAVGGPTSLLAISELLSRLLAKDPFDAAANVLGEAVRGLPQTPFVAQNEENIVVEVGGRAMLRQPGGGWIPYLGSPGQ